MLQISRPTETASVLARAPIGYAVGDLVDLPPSPTRNALLAFALVAHHGLPIEGAARFAGANTSYVSRLANLAPAQRAMVASGKLKLSRLGNGHSRADCPNLQELIKAASPEERLAAARAVGPATIWAEMVEPLIGPNS